MIGLDGSHGCGHQNDVNKLQKLQCFGIANRPDTQIVKLGLGSIHTLFLARNGQVWACGWGSLGQITGTETVIQPRKLTCFPDMVINDVLCGWHQSYFFTTISGQPKVYICGSNSSGELGLSREVDKVQNPIPFKFPELDASDNQAQFTWKFFVSAHSTNCFLVANAFSKQLIYMMDNMKQITNKEELNDVTIVSFERSFI